MSLLNLSPAEFCEATKACAKGRDWALTHPTMADVWDNCRRVDWLLWIAERVGQKPDDHTLRLFAVWCARNTPLSGGLTTGELLTDPRSLTALEVTERFARGKATLDELDAARSAAWDAWRAQAAEAAAWAAVGAAEAAARDAARGAEAAEAAARWLSPAGSAGAAARDAALATQAAYFRTLIPNPFGKEAQP